MHFLWISLYSCSISALRAFSGGRPRVFLRRRRLGRPAAGLLPRVRRRELLRELRVPASPRKPRRFDTRDGGRDCVMRARQFEGQDNVAVACCLNHCGTHTLFGAGALF